jgi:hypothetical protein
LLGGNYRVWRPLFGQQLQLVERVARVLSLSHRILSYNTYSLRNYCLLSKKCTVHRRNQETKSRSKDGHKHPFGKVHYSRYNTNDDCRCDRLQSTEKMIGNFFCLKPSHSLRRQLLLSFGSSALLTLMVVVVVACTSAKIACDIVKGSADELLRDQVIRRLVNNSLYVAETFQGYMENIEGSVQLIVEYVENRIVGYPEAGWEEDKFVPFLDMETNASKYPLQSTPLKLDWEVETNIIVSNGEEHLLERSVWLQGLPPGVLASTPSFFIQGSCDPSETDPASLKYAKNCTEASNDVRTGGNKVPTNTSYSLYEKAADIGLILKAVFESTPDIALAGVYFHNSGAGSMVQYPGHVWGTLSSREYVSDGCDWMRSVAAEEREDSH